MRYSRRGIEDEKTTNLFETNLCIFDSNFIISKLIIFKHVIRYGYFFFFFLTNLNSLDSYSIILTKTQRVPKTTRLMFYQT